MHILVHIEEDARPVLEDAAFLIRQTRDDIHQGKSQVAFATTIGTVYPHLCNYAITHTLFAEFVVMDSTEINCDGFSKASVSSNCEFCKSCHSYPFPSTRIAVPLQLIKENRNLFTADRKLFTGCAVSLIRQRFGDIRMTS